MGSRFWSSAPPRKGSGSAFRTCRTRTWLRPRRWRCSLACSMRWWRSTRSSGRSCGTIRRCGSRSSGASTLRPSSTTAWTSCPPFASRRRSCWSGSGRCSAAPIWYSRADAACGRRSGTSIQAYTASRRASTWSTGARPARGCRSRWTWRTSPTRGSGTPG